MSKRKIEAAFLFLLAFIFASCSDRTSTSHLSELTPPSKFELSSRAPGNPPQSATENEKEAEEEPEEDDEEVEAGEEEEEGERESAEEGNGGSPPTPTPTPTPTPASTPSQIEQDQTNEPLHTPNNRTNQSLGNLPGSLLPAGSTPLLTPARIEETKREWVAHSPLPEIPSVQIQHEWAAATVAPKPDECVNESEAEKVAQNLSEAELIPDVPPLLPSAPLEVSLDREEEPALSPHDQAYCERIQTDYLEMELAEVRLLVAIQKLKINEEASTPGSTAVLARQTQLALFQRYTSISTPSTTFLSCPLVGSVKGTLSITHSEVGVLYNQIRRLITDILNWEMSGTSAPPPNDEEEDVEDIISRIAGSTNNRLVRFRIAYHQVRDQYLARYEQEIRERIGNGDRLETQSSLQSLHRKLQEIQRTRLQ